MGKKNLRRVVNLSRLMSYMLGTRPDEFGLVPNTDGYIPIKEVLKAISEEPGSGYVRESHVKEVLLHDTDAVFEMSGKKIRSRNRTFAPLDKERHAGPPSKILFKGVKRKAYPDRGERRSVRDSENSSHTRRKALPSRKDQQDSCQYGCP